MYSRVKVLMPPNPAIVTRTADIAQHATTRTRRRKLSVAREDRIAVPTSTEPSAVITSTAGCESHTRRVPASPAQIILDVFGPDDISSCERYSNETATHTSTAYCFTIALNKMKDVPVAKRATATTGPIPSSSRAATRAKSSNAIREHAKGTRRRA